MSDAPRTFLPPEALEYSTAVKQRINLAWLIKLRWGAALGQFLAILAAYWVFDLALPMGPLLCVLALTVGSNGLFARWASRTAVVSEGILGALVALDILLLTALLYFTGGPTNPFHFLYLVHMALAAVILRARWLGCLVGLSLASFGWLLWDHVPLPLDAHAHQEGTAVAFVLAAVFIVYFVRRLTAALLESEKELASARERAARDEKLTSLATLAAGAAHELATPLATIAVVAKELERQLDGIDTAADGPCEDARLIRREVERCRNVLTQMAADAGASTGESFTPITAAILVEQAVAGLSRRDRLELSLGAAAETRLCVPVRSVEHAVRAVIKNALEASEAPVRVVATEVEGTCYIRVEDQGEGMSAQVLARLCEPFFTTKSPGYGMGLGLFLTRAVLERLGGALHVSSVPGRGTTAVLRMPVAARHATPARGDAHDDPGP